MNNIKKKEISVLNNFIGLHPTGLMDFNGTLKFQGKNDIVNDASYFAQLNLEKLNDGQFICNNMEKFENKYEKSDIYERYEKYDKYDKYERYEKYDKKSKIYIILIFIFLIILIILINL